MENNNSEDLIDIIKNNIVCPAPNQAHSLTKMYLVGDDKLHIIVQCESGKSASSIYCIKHAKIGKEYITITDKDYAQKIFDTCEEKITEQKIDKLNQKKASIAQGTTNVHPTR